jgi:pimeloyl-ACP methyl ester carboxylesterase
VAVDGFGAAMIGHREQNEERLASEPTMPSAGYALPLNARVEFSGSEARLCLQDLMVDGTAEVAGKSTSLEGDLTAALSFYYFARKRETKKIMATLRPGKFEGSMGLFSIEPYRDDKIPLVIVHGLMSSAESWIGFINLLRADPVVRERYQILLFNYPSGNPIQRSAAELRSALASYWEFHDPKERNPSMDDAVILGHSMGGILTSMQIRDSDRDLEGAFLKRPIEELDLSDEEKQELARAFRFEANEDLTRAILIAAPHRGSEMARNPIGNLGARLIRLPFDLLDSVLGELMVVDALTDVAQEMVGRPMNSVTSLRPDNPLLTEVLELPVDDGVEVHSIIARKDPQDHLLESSDGVVAYTSAQLDKVVSELVVDDADHRSVVENPACVDEVWRLLREHCGVSR